MVEKPPEAIVERGETHFEPGFHATSKTLYPTEAEARLEATSIVQGLYRDEPLAEASFDLVDIERPSTQTPAPSASIGSREYRQDRARHRRGEPGAPRPFRLRDAMPERRDPFFRVHQHNGESYVVFDGNTTMSRTPPQVSHEKAEAMARQLNGLQASGAKIDFAGFGFGKNQPSGRRVFLIDQGDQSLVLFNGNRKLGRSPAMPREQAEALREQLAEQLLTGEAIDWKRTGFRWGRHPDRLQIRQAETGQGFRLVYEFRDQAALSNTLFATEADANQALDQMRRQLFRGATIDSIDDP